MNTKSFLIGLIIAALGSSRPCSGQINSLDTQLIKVIFDGDIAKRTKIGQQIIYTDRPTGSVRKIKEIIMNDKPLHDNYHAGRSISLTSKEKDFISHALDSISQYSWPDHLFSNSKRINGNDETAFWAALQNERLQDKQLPGHQESFIYTFSKPIYIRNNSMALIGCALICGGECGETEMAFYEQVSGVWEKYIVISAGDF